MCGIAGILNFGPPGLEVLREKLGSLRSGLKHRGPDDDGWWMSADGHAGLVHTRLAILDLSPGGHQPMLSADGQVCIVFNGEIYNFHALRKELEREGGVFHTESDTEVLLKLYQRDGAAMVNRLRGMFAFCIWDATRRSAFLARDPMGIKPLYYTVAGETLAFASELRALQAAGLCGTRLNASAVRQFFETGSVPEPLTLIDGVRCLPAGHTLTWNPDGASEQRYWRIEFSPQQIGRDEAVTLTRSALLDSVRHHFVSDVPVGIFLSGGIDSTAVLALAREIGQTDIRTFSIGVDDVGLDESSAAARTAAHFGTQHHEKHLDAAAMEAAFPGYLAQMDQPSIDGFNTHTVSGFAREHGVKVVLSGLGGDELFGGYPSFQKVPQLRKLGRRMHAIPGLAQAVGWAAERGAPTLPWRRAGSFLRCPPTLANAYAAFRGIFAFRDARRLAAEYCGIPLGDVPDRESVELPEGDERDQVSACEISLYMRNQLLKDSDVMSMAHGLELRVPFVDRMLFETLAKIPAAVRLQSGKRLLVDAVPEVPAWIACAPKRGFLFPYQKWLAASWGDAFKEVADRLSSSQPNWYQLWSVFMLERWLKRP